jgi:hypothetical protein
MPIHGNHHPADFLSEVFTSTSEKVGGVVAGAMISSPFWIQEVKPYSDVAALFAPILGCIYLSLQIGFKLWDRTRNDE